MFFNKSAHALNISQNSIWNLLENHKFIGIYFYTQYGI